tara:strand:- start:912 stop:1754 length:843 start_codon:yes stop_codon:yes gene_type:complete
MILKKTFVTKKKFNFPIFCVGNIYLGGTGKTPLSIEIAEILKKFGKKTAIIKKSYKNHRDEFKLIESKKIKLFTNTSRIKAVKKAEIEKFDCVVLDDGLQDASITKDLNIVCFNGKKLAGNEMTLPSGPLREPLSTLKNNQIVVINGDVNKIFEKRIRAMSKHINIYYSQYLPKNLTEFKNQNLLAFAGIGNPNNFFNLLEKNNLQVKKKIAFPDHYNYSLKELNNLVKYSKSNNLKIVTTEKDYFRIKHHRISQIKHLIIKLKIKKRAKFERELIKCFL